MTNKGAFRLRHRTRLAGAARGGSAEAGRGPGAGLACLDLAIAGRRVGHERVEELMRGVRHLVHCPVEGGLVGFCRPREAAELADELQRGRTDLFVRGGRLEVVQSLDVAAHEKPRNGGNTAGTGARLGPMPRTHVPKGRTGGRHDQVKPFAVAGGPASARAPWPPQPSATVLEGAALAGG